MPEMPLSSSYPEREGPPPPPLVETAMAAAAAALWLCRRSWRDAARDAL